MYWFNSQKTRRRFLKNVNWLTFVMEVYCVFHEVRIEILNIVHHSAFLPVVPESVSGGRRSYLGIIISALFNFKHVNRITEIV